MLDKNRFALLEINRVALTALVLSFLFLPAAAQENPAPASAEGAANGAQESAAPTAQDPAPPALEEEEEVIPSNCSYKIKASLITDDWRIQASETVTFLNGTAKPVNRLLFHLTPNAYANTASLREIGIPMSRHGVADAGEAYLGYLEIHEVTFGDGTALPQPPAVAGTVMTVPLAHPLEPGDSTTLTLSFTTKLPYRGLGPCGWIGRHVDAFGWYPRLGVLTDKGWLLSDAPDCGDFADYEVSLSLPAEFEVDATGTVTEQHEENAVKTVGYQARRVKDFAWTADPGFMTEKNIYKNVEIVIRSQPYMSGKVPGLMDTAKNCLDQLDVSFTAYPHKRLVIEAPPYGLSGSAGRPMVVSVAQGFPTHLDCHLSATLDPEALLVKEMARQYVCGVLGCADESLTWMNEGLATYLHLGIMDQIVSRRKPVTALRSMEQEIMFFLSNRGFGLYPSCNSGCARETVFCGRFRPLFSMVNLTSIMGYFRSPFHPEGGASLFGYTLDNLNTPGGKKSPWASLKEEYLAANQSETAQSMKFALALKTLENHMGRETMNALLKTYVNRHRYSHPTLDDFLAVIQEGTGRAEASMMEELLRSRGPLDYGVESVTCCLARKAKGYRVPSTAGKSMVQDFTHEEESHGSTWSNNLSFGSPDPMAEEGVAGAVEGTAEQAMHQWEVVVANRGETVLPVTLLLTFEKGKTEIRTWDGKGPILRLQGKGREKLLSAAVDPECLLVMDVNRSNNFRSVAFNEKGVLFLSSWAQFWIQNYLNGWAFFN